MEKVYLDENLVFPNLDLKTDVEVESFLADELKKTGYVKDGYKKALLEREKEFPTGLPSSAPAVAIPHANADLVNKTTLAIATLKDNVEFKNMANIEESVSVKIVIMLVISEPHSQVEMLQKIVEIVQDEELRRQITGTDSKEELLEMINKAIA